MELVRAICFAHPGATLMVAGAAYQIQALDLDKRKATAISVGAGVMPTKARLSHNVRQCERWEAFGPLGLGSFEISTIVEQSPATRAI